MKALPRLKMAHFSTSQFRTRLVLAVAVLNLMVIGLAYQSLSQGLEQSRGRAAVATQNIAQLLDHDLTATFDRIDLTLQALVDELEEVSAQPGGLGRFSGVVQRHVLRQPELGDLYVVDAEGSIMASTGPPNFRRGLLADREYFRRLASDMKAGLVISPPLKSRLTDEWIITLSRRFNTDDGEFAGAVVAGVRLAHLRKLFASLDLGPQGAVSLRDLDLRMVVRQPDMGSPTSSTGSRTVSAELEAAVRAAPAGGTYHAVTRMDNIERTNTYRRMQRYPFYLLVGLADEDYLAGWYRERARTIVHIGLFILATLFMLGLLIDTWACREEDISLIASTENELRTLLDTAPDAIVIADGAGLIQRANQQALSVFGYAHEALIGQPLHQLFAADDGTRVSLGLPCRDLDLTGRAADGRRFPISISSTPTSTAKGPMLTLVIRDITERQEREEALHLASLVYQAVGEAIMVTDGDSRIVAVNPAFTRLTGYGTGEALGKPASLLRSGHHDAAFFRAMHESLASTGSWKGEIINRHKNGEPFTSWLVINSLFDESGRVRGQVGMYSPVTRHKRAEESLWRQASYDNLTGLPNRRLFLDRMQQEMSLARREDALVAIMLIDLDHFKEVNDSLGHLAGDQLLAEVGRRITACIRESDTAARLGGDEFAVILAGLRETGPVQAVADGILRALAGSYRLRAGDARVTASIGIAIFPKDGEDTETLIQKADESMYAVKNRGRNGICMGGDTPPPQEEDA